MVVGWPPVGGKKWPMGGWTRMVGGRQWGVGEYAVGSGCWAVDDARTERSKV